MKKKLVGGLALLSSLLIILGMGACIYKLNQKINQVGSELQQFIAKEESLNGENNRQGYIPALVPQGQGWIVTQFGDVQGEQEMCYVITNDTGLVIVDGGYSYEVPRLRKIIAQFGNSVEAWILTHPHPDHISAFMDIYDDLQGIEIHHIYAPEHPSQELMVENASWDDYSALERFRSMDIPQLSYVHTGDHLNLLGLDVEILSCYEDKVDELSKDLMNDGSMMFRICGAQESMLFCADVGKSLSEYLVDTYGDQLKSDYVQMGHHGYGGLKEAFYKAVAPKGAFFDASGWLMTAEDERSAKPKEELMESLGCVIFSYFTAPNQILLK